VVKLILDHPLTDWGSRIPKPFSSDNTPLVLCCYLHVFHQRYLDADCLCLPIAGAYPKISADIILLITLPMMLQGLIPRCLKVPWPNCGWCAFTNHASCRRSGPNRTCFGCSRMEVPSHYRKAVWSKLSCCTGDNSDRTPSLPRTSEPVGSGTFRNCIRLHI
jgi:hypothetical protein